MILNPSSKVTGSSSSWEEMRVNFWDYIREKNGCSVERWGVGIRGKEKRLLRDKSQMSVWWW